MFLIHSTVDQAPLQAAALVGACRGDGWQTPLQPRFLGVLFHQLLGYEADFDQIPGLSAEAVAEALPTAEQRLELVELMVTLEMLCDSIPAALEASIEHWAGVLGVEDRSLRLARDLAAHASAQALHDFYRYDWVGEQDILSPAFEGLLARHGDKAYALTVEPDPLEAARWRALEHCPAGSIGRSLWDFYQERCFGFPGEPGAANVGRFRHLPDGGDGGDRLPGRRQHLARGHPWLYRCREHLSDGAAAESGGAAWLFPCPGSAGGA
jgi:hypothetical protein